jgi:hemolysin activation/secretion protein
LLVSAAEAPGLTQESPTPEALRERTGPNAAPPPAPSYPAATELQEAPASPPPAPAPAVPAGAAMTFTDINVVDDLAVPARPRPDWVPSADPVTGLTLDLRPGEWLDGAWVRRQFVDNGLIGAPVPLDRIVAFVQQINLAFVVNGYINSGILISGAPPSDGGVLELTLVSGRVVPGAPGAPPVAVSWSEGGPRGLTEAFILDRMPAATRVPFDSIELEREFRLLTGHPAIRTVNVDLQPGLRPGEATLNILVDPQPRTDLYLTAANNRAPSIGGERFAAGGSIRSLVAAGDMLSGEAGITGGRGDVGFAYEAPFLDPLTLFSIRGAYNEAAVIDPELRPLDIEATELAVEGGVERSIFRRPLTPGERAGEWRAARTVSLGLRLAHRRSISYLLGRRFSFSPGSVDGRTEYSALRFTADWVERGIDEVAALSITATQGFGHTESDIPGLLTPETDFRALLVQFSYARRLNEAGLELRARINSQLSDGLLYSGERFAVGGEYTVRGYRETLVLADRGANASVELAHPLSLTGGRRDESGVDWGAFSVFGFADGAVVSNAAGPQPFPDELASVGLGLAWIPSDAIFAQLTVAEALIDAPVLGSSDIQDRGVQFRITVRPLAFFANR